jgi:DNA-binding IscR family transcriptional regulator
MELVMMIEGKEEVGKACISNKGKCELFDKCNIVTPVEQLNKKLNLYLETLTLAELLNGTSFTTSIAKVNSESVTSTQNLLSEIL